MSIISNPTDSRNAEARLDEATEARLEALAREWTDLDAARQPILERMEQIKAEYRRLLGYGTVTRAGLTISVQHNPLFEVGRFAEKYPLLKYPHLYKSTVDMNAIRENLAPAEIQTFQKEGTPKVVVK